MFDSYLIREWLFWEFSLNDDDSMWDRFICFNLNIIILCMIENECEINDENLKFEGRSL